MCLPPAPSIRPVSTGEMEREEGSTCRDWQLMQGHRMVCSLASLSTEMTGHRLAEAMGKRSVFQLSIILSFSGMQGQIPHKAAKAMVLMQQGG